MAYIQKPITLSSIASLFNKASIILLNITATYIHFGRKLFLRTYNAQVKVRLTIK